MDNGLCDPSGEVCGGTIDLAVVLSGESTTTVGSPSTVGVYDDLTSGETGITLWATNDEEARRLDLCLRVRTSVWKLNICTYVVDGLVVKVLCWDDLLDDLLLDLLTELLGGDLLTVLGGDNDGVNTLGDNGTVVVLVLDGDLSLGVRSEPWKAAVVAGISHGLVELVGEDDGQWQKLRGLIGGITEHDTLVTGTKVLEALLVVETLCNIGRLLLNGNEHVASLVVETLGGVIVSNILDGVTDDLLVV